ncbi:winged helix-turn-helix transcriptional regulator [Acidianus sulfidivorans JP7]|uniref:AsnC family transcriptional regulator n=1 Tax=Acidianus sulfidivorans JP7 TaxID=619593 RepID=A0A2U9IK17_9CREN|nr:Lrp/AsnC family transcriptional regulator [Acidianus sulfidivorans]AWR96381.1 winged helix-turn-helix transcriptional regulator [Acidianus sulfidivorans JP7]
MDEINKKILFYMLRDYRTSQRAIAKNLGLSSPAVNYRVDKLLTERVIKKVSVYINPNFYQKYHAYVAFKNLKEWNGEYIFKVNCLEQTNIYEIEGNDISDLQNKIDLMSKTLGTPRMIYIPKNQNIYNSSNFDFRLVSILKNNPQISIMDLADEMKVSTKTIRRHLRYLFSRNLVRLVPIIDLNKAELLMYAVFTSKVELAKKFFSQTAFREISDENAGIFVNVARDLEEVKTMYNKFREFDEDADLMIAIDYDVA